MNKTISIPESIMLKMQEHIEQEAPHEACGILGGLGSKVMKFIPIENILKSNSRYRMNPQAQIEAFMDLEREHYQLLAIYHSHPDGSAYPSKTDIQESNYPEAVHIIWALSNNKWKCKGFVIGNMLVERINIQSSDKE